MVKINYFKAGLSTTLKNRLSQQLDLPSTYAEFLKTVQRLDRRTDHTYTGAGGGQKPQYGSDKMDISNIQVNIVNAIR
jgi:hypothetical protein